MKTYSYWDHSKNQWIKGHWEYNLFFECTANDILEADQLFKEKNGKDPQKMSNIGVTFIEKTN